MLRKMLLITVVLLMLASVMPAAAQDAEGGIVCDDATYMLALLAEIHGYSKSESTAFEIVDFAQFDFGENQFAFDLLVPALSDPEMEPMTDDIVMNELLPAIEQLQADQPADATSTSHGDIVDEDPACRQLRESTTSYLAAALLREYVAEMQE